MSWTTACLISAALTAAASPAAPVDWAADLRALGAGLEANHPSPYHTIGAEEFARRVAALEAAAPALPEHQAIVRIAELVAAVGDGHTRLSLPLSAKTGLFPTHSKTDPSKVAPFHHLPIRLVRASDGYLVVRATAPTRRALGAALVAIDGHAVTEIEAALTPVVHRDGDAQLQESFARFMVVPEVLEATGIARSVARSRWTLSEPGGRRFDLALEALDADAETAWIGEAPTFLRPATGGENFRWERRPGDLFILRIWEINDSAGQSFAAMVAELDAAMAATTSPTLVIDLRGNFGGNGSVYWPLVRSVVRMKALAEPGRLFVATDGGTFSAASMLAVDLEKWTAAVFVGQPTGGSPNGYGDSRRVVLPHSGLTARISTLYHQSSGPKDKRTSVAPQIAIAPTLADLRAGRDPVMEAVRAALPTSAVEAGAWEGVAAFRELDAAMRLSIVDLGGASSAHIAIPSIGLPETTLEPLVTGPDGMTRATAAVGKSRIPLAWRQSGTRLFGTLEYLGRPYPFVLERAPGVTADARGVP